MPTEIGEMQVGLSLDEASFVQSMNSLEGSVNELSGKFDSLNADTMRTENSLKGVGKSFIALGVAGATALIAIAKDSPAVSGAMASMEVSSIRLQNAVGEGLAPAFDKGAEAFGKLADYFEANSGTISESIISEIDKIENRIAVIDKIFQPLKKVFEDFKESGIGQTLFGQDEKQKTPAGQVINTLFGDTFKNPALPFNPLKLFDLFQVNPETGRLQIAATQNQENSEYTIMNSPNTLITP